MPRQDGHATGMAGEFFVMEQLFRLGHMPALTLGNAKMVDILVRTAAGHYAVSVKAVRSGGKWGVGIHNYSNRHDLMFVFLRFRRFEDLTDQPLVHVVPAPDVEKLKRRWFDQYAVYYSHRELAADLTPYANAWHHFPKPAADV